MYKSPLHILSDLDADLSSLSDPGFLLRLRKKLLAEFNLSDSATIDINSKAYSKDEVIKTIDVLMGNPQMPLHSFIFANKPLLDFLENDQSQVRPFDVKIMKVPEELKPMLSPLLLERIVFNLKKAFYARNFDKATDLLTFSSELQEEDKSVFYEEINKSILNLQDHIHSVRSGGFGTIKAELFYLNKNSLSVFLNYLPVDFMDSINSLVGEIINTMVVYQQSIKNHDRAFLYHISSMLCKVKCDEELMKLIRSNHAAFTQNYEQRSSGGSTENSGDFFSGRTISIAIFVIIFLVRIATCTRHTSSDSRPDFNYSKDQMNTTLQEISRGSAYSEFDAYRKHINRLKDKDLYSSFPVENIKEGTVASGGNPFRYLFKRSSDTRENQSMVLVSNSTGYDLIVITYNDQDASAAYFYNDKIDTVYVGATDKICLYFGDSLAFRRGMERMTSMGVAHEPLREMYFKFQPAEALDIFNKDFALLLKKPTGRLTIPKIKLNRDFFKNQRYENHLLILHDLSLDLKDRRVFTKNSVDAIFPGGDGAMSKFIQQNIVYPPDAAQNGIQGRALVYFEVDENGKVANVWLKKGFYTSCDKEALRVVKMMPDWQPATNSGKPVRSSKVLPVRFSLEDNS